MYRDDVEAVGQAARGKVNLLTNNPLGYFLSSALAGAYIGFGILLIFTIGGQLAGSPFTKTVMGASFGVALSLVVIAGGDLFTGNTMVGTLGILEKTVSLREIGKLWIVCYLGNWAGSILLALVYMGTGLCTGPVAEFMANGALGKMTAGFMPLFFRGALCNILVCVAVWCGTRCKSESGKLIMIFWCLFAFITAGFEHSIANMTLLTIGLLNPVVEGLTLGGYFLNLVAVTLGNMVGGILFVAVPYYQISKRKDVA